MGPDPTHRPSQSHGDPNIPLTTVPGNYMRPGRPTVGGNRMAPDPTAAGPYRWHFGQYVVPRPPRNVFRSGVAQRGQGRPAWP